jgi:RNA polymerase sigma-70 factor, ECF subfamily
MGGEMDVERRTDEELVRCICRRDGPAFEALFARHHDSVLHFLTRTLRDANAADDLTQEVFLRVWTRAEQWNGRGPFKAWALRIAMNLALNHLRTVRRRCELPLCPEAEAAEDGAAAWPAGPAEGRPDAALEQLEWRERLHRLLQHLSAEKREVFHLVHDSEMDVREVAERLGIPEGTVRSRLHYAKKQLAREWQTEWEDT